MKKGYLVLSDGRYFEGERIGADKETVGELVFTTGMEGYLETLTDESYAGQIITQTFPLIGNYGVIEEDFEGEPAALGYIVSELCDRPSNFRSQYPLDEFLKKKISEHIQTLYNTIYKKMIFFFRRCFLKTHSLICY